MSSSILIFAISCAAVGCVLILLRASRDLIRPREQWPMGTSREAIAQRVHAARLEAAFSLLGVVLAASALAHELRSGQQPRSPLPPVTSVPVTHVRAFHLDTKFAEGQVCADTAPVTGALQPATDYIAQERAKGLTVAAVVLGGHDVRELKPDLKRRYGSNMTLSQRRADCIAKALDGLNAADAHPAASGPSKAVLPPLSIVSLPVGSHYGSASADIEPATEQNRHGEKLHADRQVQLIVFSWGSRKDQP